jgi:hypothetical protein
VDPYNSGGCNDSTHRERERERERERSSSSLKRSDGTEVSTLAFIKETMVKEQQQKDENAFIQQFAAG